MSHTKKRLINFWLCLSEHFHVDLCWKRNWLWPTDFDKMLVDAGDIWVAAVIRCTKTSLKFGGKKSLDTDDVVNVWYIIYHIYSFSQIVLKMLIFVRVVGEDQNNRSRPSVRWPCGGGGPVRSSENRCTPHIAHFMGNETCTYFDSHAGWEQHTVAPLFRTQSQLVRLDEILFGRSLNKWFHEIFMPLVKYLNCKSAALFWKYFFFSFLFFSPI